MRAAAALTAVAMACAPQLASAAQPRAPVGPAEDAATVSCAPDVASWSFSDGRPRRPNEASTVRPAGAHSYVWSCRVGGRLLVVRHRAEHPAMECSAALNGRVSAWADGVKVVFRRVITNTPDCTMADEAGFVSSVRLDRRGVLTICSGGPESANTRCRATPTARKADAADPNYLAPNRRTRPGLALRISHAPTCSRLTKRLSPFLGSSRPDATFAQFTAPRHTVLGRHGHQGVHSHLRHR
jgi:hypothetical protein